MRFRSHLLLFFFLVSGTAALTCYEAEADNDEYKPDPQEIKSCSASTTHCVSTFVDENTTHLRFNQSFFACDTDHLCLAIGDNNCKTEFGSTMCCCSTDMCNKGKDEMQFPTEDPNNISLKCYETSAEDADFEPNSFDVKVCPPSTDHCLSSYVDENSKYVTVHESVFSCDKESFCQAIGNNTCKVERFTTICCCTTDLCNKGRREMPIPTDDPNDNSKTKSNVWAALTLVVISSVSLIE